MYARISIKAGPGRNHIVNFADPLHIEFYQATYPLGNSVFSLRMAPPKESVFLFSLFL